MKYFSFLLLLSLFSCRSEPEEPLQFRVLDTDFSKGRLNREQTITLTDLEKFHGHLCDGLVVGALAMQQAAEELYPEGVIDRTNLRAVSKPSPCLTDVAVYLTGGRYQFDTYYTATHFEGLYHIQRLDNQKAIAVSLNPGVKPDAIDSLGNLAVKGELTACEIDSLRDMENNFTKKLLSGNPREFFTVHQTSHFTWNPVLNTYPKTDVLNKDLPECRH